MECKTFHSFVTKTDDARGVVEAYFAVMGNVDLTKDVIHPGAFERTFAERRDRVRVLDNHRTDSIMSAIGKPLLLKEVARRELPPKLLMDYPEATGGAFASVQMLMDSQEGAGAFKRIKAGAISDWSFGFDVVKSDVSTVQKNGESVRVRNLRELKLYEISPTLFGANPATMTVGTKHRPGPDGTGSALHGDMAFQLAQLQWDIAEFKRQEDAEFEAAERELARLERMIARF